MRREVETTRPDAHALRAARTMRRHKYGCLPVVDRDGHLVGIITEADFLDLAIRVLEDFDVPRASAPSA
jgi:CBS domain-containing protein